ncbi:hypothetical protein RHMOL_Rhmol07G0044500 [Rhododendron molle]|uniref:Uncharacterized protein n=1 Tax=Rhododendron molle TaxID=49168 RepID=A0ACC0MY40_RHOML|nr:hypothetical protein RHMOL_Rhmol07G0044500 [Rhododendron molle]
MIGFSVMLVVAVVVMILVVHRLVVGAEARGDEEATELRIRQLLVPPRPSRAEPWRLDQAIFRSRPEK